MSTMDIFNVDDSIREFTNDANKDDLNVIVEEFKRGHFPNVLYKTKAFRQTYEPNNRLARILSLLDATCHAQIGEGKRAADIIRNIYQHSNTKSVDDLILYGNLAFMCDYKLARRIMSDAVKQVENEDAFDPLKAGQAFLVLGEAEEHLEKFVRAIKYYKRGLTYFQAAKEQNRQMILFLHFKLGALHSMTNKTDKAIEYLEKTIDLTEENDLEIKINSLVSLAKMYGSKDDSNKAIAYLETAIPLLEDSTLAYKLVHAEAYTEMAYNYFDQSKFDQAVPYYERAIGLHLGLPNYSPRELGMIYMQYAYCVENKEPSDTSLAGRNYEKAYEQLEKTKDLELIENSLADIIAFFNRIDHVRKKRFYENKFVKLTNEKASYRLQNA